MEVHLDLAEDPLAKPPSSARVCIKQCQCISLALEASFFKTPFNKLVRILAETNIQIATVKFSTQRNAKEENSYSEYPKRTSSATKTS